MISSIKAESTEHHFKKHKVTFLTPDVEELFRAKCCEVLGLDPKGFGLSGKLSMELEIKQMSEGSPSYAVQKWQAHVKITERVDS